MEISMRIVLFCLMVVFLLFPGQTMAETARGFIEKGNAAYQKEDFDNALSFYDKAVEKDPQSPYVHFNRGNAFYKKGDYAQALSAYEQSLVNRPDRTLLSKSKLNMGNTLHRTAEQLQQTDPESALAMYNESIGHYRAAMEHNEQLAEAGKNIELTKLRLQQLKKILAQKRQKQQLDKQSKHKMADDLKEMIDEQQEMAQKSGNQADDNTGSDGSQEELAELVSEQKQLQEDTQKMADKMAENSSQGQGAPSDEQAHESLSEAVKQQQEALDNLEASKPGQAAQSQKKAAEKLKEALGNLGEDDDPPPPEKDAEEKNGEKTDADKEGEEQKQEEERQSQQGKAQNSDETPSQFKGMNSDQTAEDLLNQEKQNKLRRRMMNSQRYEAVEKDW